MPDMDKKDGKIADRLNDLMDTDSAYIEALFNVAHYNKEYKSPASLADVAFELAEPDVYVHESLSQSWKIGSELAETMIDRGISEGFIKPGSEGGYIITNEGRAYIAENKDKLGKTYESEHEADTY
jgi:hypothetical protein